MFYLLLMIKNAVKHPLGMSIIGALLLWVAWPTSSLFPLLFVGMSFLLIAAKRMIDAKKKGPVYFFTLFLSLLLWNILTTAWIKNATWAGMIMAVVGNSLLMYLPFLVFRWTHKSKAQKIAPFVFLCCWLAYEYLHHNWSLSWPWITLGNGMAEFPSLIQWYEYTGTAGGSLWILGLNLLFYGGMEKKKFSSKRTVSIGALMLLPMLWSWLITLKYDELPAKSVEVVLLQPNFNTYTQKSSWGSDYIPPRQQLAKMIAASKEQLTQNTSFLVWPETALIGAYIESKFTKEYTYRVLDTFLLNYPKLTLISGIDSYEYCKDQENPTQYAAYNRIMGFYESYNSALMMNTDTFAFYHKSKFVPGAEQVPFPWLIKPLETLLGGVGFGHYFGQEKQTPFFSKSGVGVTPAICYESIYGEHLSHFVQNGADLHLVVTNDDWWHDTEGHRQHYEYARLRAIETRTPVARSANTGFSGFFDILGQDSQKTTYRTPACIKQNVPLYDYETVYLKHGDYIGRTAAFLSCIFLISVVVKRIKISLA